MKKLNLFCKTLVLVMCFVFAATFLVGCNQNEPVHVQYDLYLLVNDPLMGNVYGAGVYCENETIEICAVAKPGYKFVQWSDGNTQNARKIEINGDKTLQASFAVDPPAEPAEPEEKYYLNSVSLYYYPSTANQANKSLDYDEIYLFSLYIKYGFQTLGGFNIDNVTLGYSNSILFSQNTGTSDYGFDINNKLTIYTDASKRVLFDENQLINISVDPNFQVIKSGNVSVPTDIDDVILVMVSPNTTEARALCWDNEKNYVIYITFDFELAQ